MINIVESSPKMMELLRAVQSLDLVSWCVGAGSVRSLVWDRLHNYSVDSIVPDVDVAYYDKENVAPEYERAIDARLRAIHPDVNWEVTNQAGVHQWYSSEFGCDVPPIDSLISGIATWPEFATCIGVSLNSRSQVVVFAPFGLEDLFSMTVRRNPARVTSEVFLRRVEQKKFAMRWPKVKVHLCLSGHPTGLLPQSFLPVQR